MSADMVAPEVEEEWEEPEDAALRKRLSLGPIWYPESGHHPDDRPCPVWCWLAHEGPDGYKHQLAPGHVREASHGLEVTPRISLGLHEVDNRGDPTLSGRPSSDPRFCSGRLASEPAISLRLHHYPAREMVSAKFLKLTVDDASELIMVMTYVRDVAEGRIQS